MTTRPPGGSSTLERALIAIQKMEAKLAAVERAKSEPLAIIGMSCRLPGGVSGPSALWELACAGVDAITEVPPHRFAHAPNPQHPSARFGGFLENVDEFDAAFFGISRNEAVDLDPQQRYLLEVAWEALEDAGISPHRLASKKTGVFVGISAHDYAHLLFSTDMDARPYVSTGTASCFAAGRLAFTLGLTGPCLTVDTACSSSLVALHLACQSLRRGECDMALVGGVNLLLSPATTSLLASLQVLSPDGRCRTFDDRANGYVRAEGAGMIVLERRADAQQQRDRIWALVRGSAINQNGRASSLTAPNLQAQTAVIRAALEDARVTPEQIGYVEVHSNGSPLGDPVELEALRATIGKPRANGSRCVLGSIKTCIGHTEAASGMASIIKSALVLNHETIPPNLHFQSLNQNASLDDTPFVIPTSETTWRRGEAPRISGVSATGLSGANAHVVLEEPPPIADDRRLRERSAHLLVLSAKSPAALHDSAKQMLRHLQGHPEQSLGDVCHTLGVGRAHFEHRFAATLGSAMDAMGALTNFLDGSPGAYHAARVEGLATRRRVGFVFTGDEKDARSALEGLGSALPALDEALSRGDDAVHARLGRRVLPILFGRDDAPPPGGADDDLALFVLQYALVEVFRSWGIEPSTAVGYGAGECCAAWAAGVLELEQAIDLAAARADLRRSEGRDQAAFAQVISRLRLSTPRRTLVPSLGGAFSSMSLGSEAYWMQQIAAGTSPDVTRAASPFAGHDAVITIGVGRSGALKAAPAEAPPQPVASLRQSRPPARSLLECLAELYVSGIDVRWEGFEAPYAFRRVALPTYPFQRQRYWFGAAQPAAATSVPADGHPLLGVALEPRADRPNTRTWELVQNDERRPGQGAQRLVGLTVLGSATIVETAAAAAREMRGDGHWELGLSLGDLPALQEGSKGTIQIIATPEADSKISIGIFFCARSGAPWQRLANGVVTPLQAADAGDRDAPPPSMRAGRRQSVPSALWEQRFEAFGVDPSLFHVDQLWRSDVETLARISLSDGAPTAPFLRAAVAVASITHPAIHGRSWQIDSVEGVVLRQATSTGRLWLRVTWEAHDGLHARASVAFIDEEGVVAATVRRMDLRVQDPASALRALGKDPIASLFVDMVWQELLPSPRPLAQKRRWILILDAGGVGESLAKQLEAAGDTVMTFAAADVAKQIDKLDLVLGVAGSFFGVVHLGALDAPANDSLSEATLEGALRAGAAAMILIAGRLAALVRVPRLFIVTRGAHDVTHDAPAIAQSGLSALGRCLRHERPDMWGGSIDLDPRRDAAEASRVAEILALEGTEDFIAQRGEKRYVPRLTRIDEPIAKSIEVRPDRTYLVTGARTALGVDAARWLVERGARRLLLVHGLSTRDAHASAAAPAFTAEGVEVSQAEFSLADPNALRDVLSRLASPLGGVIHAEAATDMGATRLTSAESTAALQHVFRTKTLPLLSLHALTTDAGLDFFFVFSSAPSALGWEGFGADAFAAEQADAIVRRRRALGLHAASVHVAFPHEARPGRTELELELLAAGFQGLPAGLPFDAAERLVSNSHACATAAWIDWELFEFAHQAHTGGPLFERLVRARDTNKSSAKLRLRVANAEPEQAQKLVEGIIRAEVARVLGVSPAELAQNSEPLTALGMDSIMSIQVLTAIGTIFEVRLPVTMLLSSPSIEALSRRVTGELRGGDDATSTEPRSRQGLLVELVREGQKPPLFIAPPLTGSSLIYQSLVQHMGKTRPVYSFEAPGVDTDVPPCDRIEVLAAHFIEAMRRAQPKGPYYIGGYSFGGLIAYEMAQILRRGGENVEMLVLGDVPPFGHWAGRNPLVLLARLFDIPVDESTFATLEPDEQVGHLAAAVGARLMLPPEVGETNRQLRLYRAHLNAIRAYVPTAYDGKVVLIRAQDTVAHLSHAGLSGDDGTFGWGELCAHPVRVFDVPGDHFNALFFPAVAEFSRVLGHALDDADAP